MKTLRSLTILMFSLFAGIPAYAQEYIDLIKLGAGSTPINEFKNNTSATRLNSAYAEFTVPILFNEKNIAITGFNSDMLQTRLFSGGLSEKFGSITLKLGLNHLFNERWSGNIIALPKIASDFLKVSNEDLQLGALGFMKYSRKSNLNFKFGLYCNTEFFGPYFVPLLGMYYLSPEEKFEFNCMLPLRADFNYRLKSYLHAGLNFNGLTTSYHLYSVTSTLSNTYVSNSTNELFAYLKFTLGKSFIIQTKAGASVLRSFRVYNENDKVNFALPLSYFGPSRKQLNTDFSNGLVYQLVLIYRISSG